MVARRTPASGVDKRLIRRLQRALVIKYTAALRILEAFPEDERLEYVIKAEKGESDVW